ncbi:UNVERIFIED_CONTAM: hypothetical protein GTU68_037723 [Idotea baltica]|nr:hypothetical protein [Idotea baltica]
MDIVQRGTELFDEVVVAVGMNSAKKYFFSHEERMEMLQATFAEMDNVRVAEYDILTVDFAKENGAKFLLRGVRDGNDLAYERPLSTINKYLSPEIETVFLVASGNLSDISSTLVREVIRYGRNPKGLVPEVALPVVARKFTAP